MKLLNSPISLRFLVDPIERALNAELPGVAIVFEDAILRRSVAGGVEMRLKNARMTDPDGAAIAMAAFASVEFSSTGLWSGRIAPSRIDLIEPKIILSADEHGRLSIRTIDPSEAPSASTGPPASPIAPDSARSAMADAGQPANAKLGLARFFAETIARARRQNSTAFLKTIGLRNATVIVDDNGRQTLWSVPSLDVGVDHKQKRSVIVGRIQVASGADPWTLAFRVEDAEKAKTISLAATLEGLVPHQLARQLPALSALTGLDSPVSGTGNLNFSTDGTVLNGRFDLDVGAGALRFSTIDKAMIVIEGGKLDLRYNGETGRLDLRPSPVAWQGGKIVLEGSIEPAPPGGAESWQFRFGSRDGHIHDVEPGAVPLAIEHVELGGQTMPGLQGFDVTTAVVKIAGAEINVTGRVGAAQGDAATLLDGRIGPMPIATMKALWPSTLAPEMRARVIKHVTKGVIKGGHFKFAQRHGTEMAVAPGPDPARRFALTLEGSDFEIDIHKGWPAIEAARALLRMEGSSLELTVPDAHVTAAAGRKITMKGSRMTVVDLDQPQPVAEIATRAQGPLAAFLELLGREPMNVLKPGSLPANPIDGKTEAQLKITLPLGPKTTFADARIEGKGRITDGRVKDIIGTHDISGASIAFDATEKGVDIKGEMLLAGVAAKLSGQWHAQLPQGKPTPLKITARLDGADRNQLGLDLEHLIQGDVPIEVQIHRPVGSDEPKVQVNVDLTSAEMTLDDLNWSKGAGKPARLTFDVGKPRTGKGIELQNFKLSGESIAIDGWVALGPDNRPREYLFPEFSLNVVTNLEVQGTLRPDRVWEVKANVKTYDGTEFFRSLFAFNTQQKPKRKNRPGIDLTADLERIVGANDTGLRQARLRLQKRDEQLTALDFRAVLDGGKPIAATLRPEPGRPHLVLVQTVDAGQALKTVGVYANMLGGVGELEVNLDGRGPAEKTGTLTIRNFRVLGDPVIAEVLQNADDSRPAIDAGKANRRMVREQFDFERLRASYSTGNGQLVLDSAAITGPLIGASARGKIDFVARRMSLGGTYVPLSGLNRAFGEIPLLGPLLTGPKGEGVFGITFAVEGPMATPQVIVNPFSIVAPGLFREIFQMTPENPRVTPRVEPAPKAAKAGGAQIRASPPAETPARPGSKPRVDPEVLGGWSSEATDNKGARRK